MAGESPEAGACRIVGASLLAAVGCEPYLETSPGLPDPPSADVQWYFLPDTVDGVVGIDSNRVVVEAEASEDVFIHLWNFGNGQISNDPVDTVVYYVEGMYGISYQGHAEGGAGEGALWRAGYSRFQQGTGCVQPFRRG